MNTHDKYFSVLTNEDGKTAEILLYGYIGQQFFSEQYREESITDVEFVKTLKQLEKKHDRINIHINSPGGSVYHGNAIVTAIQNAKAEIHTYNDGMAASMAFNIWAAAPNRHAAKNSTFMYHQMIGGALGNAKDLREVAEFLDQYDETAQVIVADAFGMSLEDFKSTYSDYTDHWISYRQAAELGLMTDKDEYESEGVIENVQSLGYAEVLAHFSSEKDTQMNFLQRIVSATRPRKKNISNTNPKSEIDMNLEDFKKSLEDNTLSVEAITEVMKEAGYQVTATAPATPEPSTPATAAATEPTSTGLSLEDVQKAITAALKPIQEKVESFSASPAAPVAQVPAGEEDDPLGEDDGDDPLKAFNETMAQAAKDRVSTPIR